LPRESATVNTWPVLPARMHTAIQLPAALLEANARVEDVVVPASLEVCCSSLIPAGGAVTVKTAVLLGCPATVTITFPAVAPAGTGTTMLEELQLVGKAKVPLKVTVLDAGVLPKPEPAMVTGVPTGPDVGLRVVMPGGRTVKLTPLLATPLTVTTTLPEPAVGTVAVMAEVLQAVTAAAIPLKVTELVP